MEEGLVVVREGVRERDAGRMIRRLILRNVRQLTSNKRSIILLILFLIADLKKHPPLPLPIS